MRIGFACNWDPVAEATWSGTPWHLMRAMAAQGETVDVGLHLPRRARQVLQLASLRPTPAGWVPRWEHSPRFEQRLTAHTARRAQAEACDVVLEIQDIGDPGVPFAVYSDMSYDIVADLFAAGDDEAGRFFRSLTPASLARRRERQHEVYARADAVIAMSGWLARSLVETTGLPADKVHLARPGATALALPLPPLPVRDHPRRRLLFVGTTFDVKGGDQVVAALAAVRRHDPSVTLTVAGPREWPLEGSVPDGVDFVGNVPRARVVELFDTHDLFVMPSRFEAYGIVFVEALARGIPCIGRRAFAMPEIITEGRNGLLVERGDPEELAPAILEALADDSLHEYARAHAEEVATAATWENTARRVLEVLEPLATVRTR